MKNLLCCYILALFAVAWTANLDRIGHDVEIIRAKRSVDFNNMFQTNKAAKKKDDDKKKKKEKKKKKKPLTTVTTTPYNVAPTSKSPGKIPKMPDELLKKILNSSREEVEKLVGITKAEKMKIEADYIKQLPKELVKVGSQSNIPAPNCDCSLQYTRVFVKHDNTPALGVYFPHNCVGTYRCLGGCMQEQLQECRPTKTSVVTHYLTYFYFNFVGKPIEIKRIDVESHQACACQCKPKKCHERQEFVDHFCGCRCKSEYTASKLNCRTPLVYDDTTCSCKCFLKHMPCSQSEEYDPTLCKCVPKPTTSCAPVTCPHGKNFNKNNCKCEDLHMKNNC